MEIPIYYDPMIAKLITYGKDREEAISRMERAIDEYQITGITTTLGFGKFVMQHEAFKSGNFDTHFVKKYFQTGLLNNDNESDAEIAAIVMNTLLNENQIILPNNETVESNWVKNRKE